MAHHCDCWHCLDGSTKKREVSARIAAREFNELLADAAAHPGEWLPDTPERIADQAETMATIGWMQSIYR